MSTIRTSDDGHLPRAEGDSSLLAMAEEPKKPPKPSSDPNRAAKAVVDRVIALTEEPSESSDDLNEAAHEPVKRLTKDD